MSVLSAYDEGIMGEIVLVKPHLTSFQLPNIIIAVDFGGP